MKNSKKLAIAIIATVMFIGISAFAIVRGDTLTYAFNGLNKYKNNGDEIDDPVEGDSLGSEATNNNAVLRSMRKLGFDIDGLIKSGKLYTSSSLASKGFSLPFKYNNTDPTSTLNPFSVGDDTTIYGEPDYGAFKTKGWACNSFINYFWFNYLPNVEGVDTSWMLEKDKYFREFKGVVNWTWKYNYCWIEGWREALDKMYVDGKADRYSNKLFAGVVLGKPGFSGSQADLIPANVTGDGNIKTGGSVYDELTPGDITIWTGTVSGRVTDNAHMALYVGSRNGVHYFADMQPSRIGFVTSAEAPSGKAKGINTWYHIKGFDLDEPPTPEPEPEPEPTPEPEPEPTPNPDPENEKYTITNTYYDGYIEISGKVWEDRPDGKANTINGTLDDADAFLGGIKVTLKNGDGTDFATNGIKYQTTTAADGTYKFIVNYDNRYSVYKLYEDAATVSNKLKTAYVEFEYDGMKYTTVKTGTTGVDTSKARENETQRNGLDAKYTKVVPTTPYPSNEMITAGTKGVISFETYADKAISNKDVVIEKCDKNNYYHTNIEKTEGAILTNKQQCGHSCTNCPSTQNTNVEVITINNVNLGLFVREQPNVAIFSDLSKVEVTMNGQKYTYLYNVRSSEKNAMGLKVKFENKDTYKYKRPVNPADISFIQEPANSNAMNVFVTYEVKVANLSTTLPTIINSVANYHDSRYTLTNEAGWVDAGSGTGFKKIVNNGLDIRLEPQTESQAIELRYEIDVEAIRGLLSENATLNNAVEIEGYTTKYGAETLYAEQGKGGRTGNPYGGYDYNSHPGNAEIHINADGRLEATKPEDDTDIAPAFVLCKDDPKTLAGTVFEDTDENRTDVERLGDSRFDSSTEKGAQNVKVELYNLDGSIAKLYKDPMSTVTTDAIVYSDGNGNYSFDGVVTGEYFVKYTYGNEDAAHATTMDGGTTTVNARNYKSTIIKNDIIKTVLGKEYSNFTAEEKKWPVTIEDNWSVAVDDMLDRLAIEDLQYSNFNKDYVKGENMTAYTKPFTTQVEFDRNGESSNIDPNDKVVQDKETIINGSLENKEISNRLDKLDFGIIERPREDIFTQKTITKIRIVLANGQELISGDPRTENLNYVKAMGFNQDIQTGEQARFVKEKLLLAELDAELTKGAQLEIQYEVTAKNNNEKDYDYGTVADYADLGNGKYITKSSKANYYYYGESAGLEEMKATIEFIDYLDNDISYDENEEANKQWEIVNIDTIYTQGNPGNLISNEAGEFVKNKGYKILQRKGELGGRKVTLPRGTFIPEPLTMTVRKVLSSNLENVYDNAVEILKIDGKTARTIQESDEGKQIEKTYKPGNYVPNFRDVDIEQDDDRVRVMITPPTGTTNNTIMYMTVGLAGLLIIVVGVIFIKKRVLKK